jgi:hypothetical protein
MAYDDLFPVVKLYTMHRILFDQLNMVRDLCVGKSWS